MKRFFLNIVLYIASFSVILLSLEIFIRFAEIENLSLTDYTKNLGRCRRKDVKFIFFNEGFSLGHFNNYRYRGPEYPQGEKNNILRIALIGDSYVEGFQVFDRDHFRYIMEKELNKGKDSVQVLNFGRSGFDLADMYVYYKRFVKTFEPDITMFFISSYDLDCKQTDILIPRVISKNDSVFINDSKKQKYLSAFLKTKRFTQNSVILNMANNCRRLILNGFLAQKLLDKLYFGKTLNSESEGKEKPVYVNPVSYKIIDDLVMENKTKILFVNKDMKRLDRKFSEYLKNKNIKVIEVSDTLNSLIKNNIDPNYWPVTKKRGHWNRHAHKAIGAFLAETKVIRN